LDWQAWQYDRNCFLSPAPAGEVEPCLAAWEKFLHESTLPPLVNIALAHYQFEAVHPFLDGSGRVGRLLITLFLIERQILPTPLLYLPAFFEASRRDYYDGLRGISERGAWNDWLEYFLLGAARMSEDALSRAMRINGLLAEWQRKVSGESSSNPLRVVELLGANPFITTKGVADKLAIAFTTAQRAIERLERARIVKRVGDAKRDRVYCATALLDILEEPARLKPATNSFEWSQTGNARNGPGENGTRRSKFAEASCWTTSGWPTTRQEHRTTYGRVRLQPISRMPRVPEA
jgi:Fic family protein